jgi:hypothetical protein
MKRSLSAAVCAALVLLSAGAGHAEDFTVKFQRSFAVGQKFDWSASLDMSQSMKLESEGKELRNDSEKGKIAGEAVMEVTAVSAKGDPAKFHLVIAKLQAATGDAALEDVAASGTEVDGIYGADGKAEFTATKGELSDGGKRALTQLFEGRDPNGKFSSDDIMGTKDKKKVGDTWDMNIKIMGEATGGAVTMDPAKTKAIVKLEDKMDVGGAGWLKFSANLDGTDLTIPKVGAAKDAKITARETMQSPVDVGNPSSKTTGDRSMHAVFELDAEGMKMKMTMDHVEKRTASTVLKK